MKNKKLIPFVPARLVVNIASCLWFLMVVCIAVCAQAENDVVSDLDARSVEIGTGGNVRVEKPYRAEMEEKFDWNLHALWESHYVTEGRKNLADAGLFSVSTEFAFGDVTVVPWVAQSTSGAYRELNINVVYGKKLSNRFEMFVGFNHLQAREEAEGTSLEDVTTSDNELSLDVAYSMAAGIQLETSVYYSLDAGGAFGEVALKRAYRINEAATITVRGLVGGNAGYVEQGHDGVNHSQLLLRGAYVFAKNLEAYAYGAYNHALNSNEQKYTDDELLRNFYWSGLGVSYLF